MMLYLTKYKLHLIVAMVIACTAGLFAINAFEDKNASLKWNGKNSFSYSAIGHRGFYELLETLGMPVQRNQRDVSSPIRSSALVVAEPLFEPLGKNAVEGIKDTYGVLLVMPKWQGTASAENTREVSSVELIPVNVVNEVLHKFFPNDSVFRPKKGSTNWNSSKFDIRPSLQNVQLMRNSGMKRLIYTKEGVLLGMRIVNSRKIFVLSDPDLINNHGLGNGNNASLAVSIINNLRVEKSRPVVFEETLHGFRIEPVLWKAMLAMPFLVPTIVAFVAAIVLIWAATNRFGAPFPMASVAGLGKRRLIENSVRLIGRGRYGGEIVSRFFSTTVRNVETRLHIPEQFSEGDKVKHLDHLATLRGAESRLADLIQEKQQLLRSRKLSDRRALRLAQRISHWKQEMLNDT